MTPCVPAPKGGASESITIGFTGDVMLGRLVNEAITKHGYAYPFGDLIDELENNHLNIINLETTLTKSSNKIPKVFNFKADPDNVESLKKGSVHVANLANNHILDFSVEGMNETIATLDKAHIKHVGAGANSSEAKKPVILDIKGTRIGIIGYTDNEPTWKATENSPGTNYIRVGDIHQVIEDIRSLRDTVDLLILTIHWGPNMREVPSLQFQTFARDVIDAGVDILHGHSAHVVQGVEIYKNKLILYDTGDFVDDYMVGPDLRNDHTFLFRVVVRKDEIVAVSLLPALIKDMQVNSAPESERNAMFKRLQKLSKPFGTTFEVNNGLLNLKL